MIGEITNKKYLLLDESLRAISNKHINILTLIGQCGEGKTFTTLKFLNDNNTNYEYISSYSTPLSFYELLYTNRDKEIVVFDDIHNISNPIILAMLKASCWTSDNNERIVSYHSTSPILESHNLPSSFSFNAKVILILNKPVHDFEPITNRGVKISFNFSFNEKLKIFQEIQEAANIEQEVLDYVKTFCNEATQNLSIRTLVILSNLKRAKYDFKQFANEMLGKDEDLELLLTLSAKEWSTETGYHIATYYRRKKRLGLK